MSALQLVDNVLSAFKKNTPEETGSNSPEQCHLRLLGRFFGIRDLSFDDSGSCIVSVNGAVIKMQMLRSGKLLMTAFVDLLPAVPAFVLLESLLVTNGRLRKRGLSLALEEGSRMIILQGELPPYDEYATYRRRVERIITVANEIKRNIEPLEFMDYKTGKGAHMLVDA